MRSLGQQSAQRQQARQQVFGRALHGRPDRGSGLPWGAAVLALAALLAASCTKDRYDEIVVTLYPGETAYVSIAVDACDEEDDLENCYAGVYDTNLRGVDVSFLNVGLRTSTECGVEVKLVASPEMEPRRYRLRVLMEFTYYDAFFEERRDDSEVVTIFVEGMAAP